MSDEIVALITCRRCGQQKVPHASNPHLCEDCVKAENNRVSYFRQHNENWLDVAKEAELEIWERQPGETDREWQVWLAYRDSYPSVKPSYRKVAEQLATTDNVVRKVGQRWDFPVRLQAWAKYVDTLTLQQRQKEIIGMNERHIKLAEKIQGKLEKAIDNIDPMTLEAKDIKGLFQVAAELERKARLDATDIMKPDVGNQNPDLQDNVTDTKDLGEVIGILQAAGLIPKQVQVGVETTQRIILKGE